MCEPSSHSRSSSSCGSSGSIEWTSRARTAQSCPWCCCNPWSLLLLLLLLMVAAAATAARRCCDYYCFWLLRPIGVSVADAVATAAALQGSGCRDRALGVTRAAAAQGLETWWKGLMVVVGVVATAAGAVVVVPAGSDFVALDGHSDCSTCNICSRTGGVAAIRLL